MTNYEAIIRMTPERMEQLLEQVYLAGLNTGMYAARQEDYEILDCNPFDFCWLTNSAEAATELGFSEEGDAYILSALAEAVCKSAGIFMCENTL